MLNGLDICAGSGIGSATFEALGLCRTVCYIEWDDYCQRLLQQRMADGWINNAPLWDDLKTFDGKPWRGLVDFMFGGIPCQPYSVAGKKQGTKDERDLWDAYKRILCEIQPSIALIENSPQIIKTNIAGELGELGYKVQSYVVAASDCGAWHERKRAWIIACMGDLSRLRGRMVQYPRETRARLHMPECGGVGGELALHNEDAIQTSHTDSAGCKEQWRACSIPETYSPNECTGWWADEPRICGVVHGVADRVDRIKIAGNGWVPQVAAVIARRITELL